MGKFKFGTAKHQTLPFTIGGLNFFSRPLTVGEELPLASISDRYDEENATAEQQRTFVTEQAAYLAGLLRSRLVGAPEETAALIDTAWVLQHFGLGNIVSVLQFLRTGQRPSEPLELRNWTDEPIEIDGFSFAMRQLNFADQLLSAELASVEGGTAAIVGSSLNVLAALLNSRLLGYEGQDPRPAITAEWLSQHLASDDIQAIMLLLQNGPEAEGDDPNAPENLGFVADGLTTSLA